MQPYRKLVSILLHRKLSNQIKNRYSDVLCLDQSRVRLCQLCDDEDEVIINSSNYCHLCQSRIFTDLKIFLDKRFMNSWWKNDFAAIIQITPVFHLPIRSMCGLLIFCSACLQLADCLATGIAACSFPNYFSALTTQSRWGPIRYNLCMKRWWRVNPALSLHGLA